MENITLLPINEYLVESPFNPRKSYPESELQELADSIKSQGVMQPIVVRHVKHDFGGGVADMEYQIVFGHRRYRAAKLAGLDLIPTIIREMDDQQAAIAQTHENSKRRDVTAFEEADSFEYLRTHHQMSADEIVKAVGMSKSYVYGRLKLAKAAPEVRTAAMAEGLGGEVALEIARITDHNLQREALTACRSWKYTSNGREADGWISSRAAKGLVRNMFKLDLVNAPFDLEDAGLNPDRGACSACPKRAGNDASFDGTLDPSICLDKACHEVKVSAHIAKALAKVRKSGLQVIEGEDAKALLPHAYAWARGYTKLADTAYNDEADDGEESSEVTFEQALKMLGKKAPKATVIVNPHVAGELIYCVTDEQANQVLMDLGLDDGQGEAGEPKLSPWERERREKEAAVRASLTPRELAVLDDWSRISSEAFSRAATAATRMASELLIICRALITDRGDIGDEVIEAMGWLDAVKSAVAVPDGPWVDEEHFVWAELARCTPDELAKFAVLCALLGAPSRRGYGVDPKDSNAEKLAIAEIYRVDVFNPAPGVQSPALDAPTPPPAARAPKRATVGTAKYRNAATGETWSGRGLQPAWLKAAIAAGKRLEDFVQESPPPAARAPRKAKSKLVVGGDPDAPDDAGLVEEVMDDAGGACERDPNTPDMFEEQKDDAGVSAGGSDAEAVA